MNSQYFSHWLGKQPRPGLLPNQIGAVVNVMPNLDTGDLIEILFRGEDSQAINALKLLRERFEDEMNFLDQLNWSQER